MNRPYYAVIDGMDGVGKETQKERLKKFYKKTMRLSIMTSSFPEYDTYTGILLREYLTTTKGTKKDLSQLKDDSLLYTMNRVQHFIENGFFSEPQKHDIHLFDRYTTSNIIYQSLELNDIECKEYVDWISHIEYDMFKLPKPDQVIVLVTNPITNQQNIKNRGLETDFFEKQEVQERVYYNILRLSNMLDKWKVIQVDDDNNQMRNIDSISEDIISAIESDRVSQAINR